MEKVKVVATALIRDGQNRVVMTKVADSTGNSIWIAPGGRAEEGETLRECAVREAKEEVGVEVRVKRLAGILEKQYEDGIWTFVYFDVEVVSGDVQKSEDDIEQLAYMDISLLDSYKDIRWLV